MQQKSTFVTVLAWIFIVISGMGLFGILMEGLLFMFLPFDKLLAQNQQQNPATPVPVTFFLSFFRWVLAAALVFQTWVFASSIGLLKRKNWARISFIVFLIFSITLNSIYLLLEIIGMIAFSVLPMHDAPQGMHGFMQGFLGVFIVFTIAFIVLFGWILRKLQSAGIRSEFVSEPAA